MRVRLRSTVRTAISMAASTLVVGVAAERLARAQCVDDELKQELVGGRHYRGVEERLFTKAFRHELSAMGGLYAGDLYSSSWVVGGAYTFHFSEDLGLEASVEFTRFRSAVTDAYERRIHNETSTGVMSPIAEIAALKQKYPDVMFIVDSVSSMSAVPLKFDELGIDVLLAGTQKA